MDRRAFLSILAGSPFVFGLRNLVAQDAAKSEKPSQYFRAALERMKELDRPGVVLLIPDRVGERLRLAEALYQRLTVDSSPVRQILTGCVFICLPPGFVRPPDDAKDDKSNGILIDADGRPLERAVIGIESFEDSEKFAISFNRLLDGAMGERLEARARKAREGASPEAREALADLDSDDLTVRERATAVLAKDLVKLQPLLIHTLRSTESTEAGLRIRGLIDKLYLEGPELEPGPRLPFGTKLKTLNIMEGGGGDCPGCGMSSGIRRQEKHLGFLTYLHDFPMPRSLR